MITFGSVCSGIEAASVAWHPMGWRAAWLAEIEPFPCSLLAHHYPEAPNLGDMTKIAAMIRDGFATAPDVLCGGTPCQAFSIAGLRNSLDDARGNLSLTFCEIADAIDARRQADGLLPAIIFWENVPGVLSTKDNAFGCFLAGLAGEDDPIVAPGGKWANAGAVYGPKRAVAWRILDAQYFGVAQRRRRVFVVASAREGFDPAAVLFEFDGVRRDSAPSRAKGQEPAGTLASRTGAGGFPGTDEACSRYVQAVAAVDVCPTLRAGGNSTGGDRPPGTDVDTADSLLVCISNAEGAKGLPFLTCSNLAKAVNNQPPLLAFEALSVALRGRDGGATAELGGEVAGCLRASSGGGDKPHVLAPAYPIQNATRGKSQSGLGIGQPGDPMYTLDQASQHAIAFDARQDCVSSTHAFGALGSSSPQAQAVAFYTLKAEGFDASEDGTGRGQPIVAAFAENSRGELRYEGGDGSRTGAISTGGGKPGQGSPTVQHGMAVRRLTPTECERLQGFPDGYTQVPHRGKPAADGPRYKALGNSWAVPVVRWIGARIDAAIKEAA